MNFKSQEIHYAKQNNLYLKKMSNYKKGFGSRFEQLKKYFGFNSIRIAQELKISPSQVTGIEKGENLLTAEKLNILSEIKNKKGEQPNLNWLISDFDSMCFIPSVKQTPALINQKIDDHEKRIQKLENEVQDIKEQ